MAISVAEVKNPEERGFTIGQNRFRENLYSSNFTLIIGFLDFIIRASAMRSWFVLQFEYRTLKLLMNWSAGGGVFA